jgi:hypothetical protein
MLTAAAAALALACGTAAAQPAPRAADGRPDLTGVWSNASLTWLTRAPGQSKLALNEAEARALAAADPTLKRAEADARPTDPNAGAPAEGGAIVGFNSFWLDAGASYARVKGEYRTSWMVDPADGQLPLTPAGQVLSREAAATRNRTDPAGPEHLSPNDRCLIGSRGSGGPGMLNNIYNSHYQIVQTPTSLVIVVEMVHDARTIPIFPDKAAAQAAHGPAALDLWLGDSVAWWEGDALVVETVNVNPQQGRFGPIFLSPKGRVTERLTRASAGQIAYEFKVEDPVYYAQPWRAEMSLNALDGQVYEYACHEGNYAIHGILAGARAAEAAPKGGGQP